MHDIQVGQQVDISIRDTPEARARRGEVTAVNEDGEFYVTDKKTFGHWYGGAGEAGQFDPDGDSIFFVEVVQ